MENQGNTIKKRECCVCKEHIPDFLSCIVREYGTERVYCQICYPKRIQCQKPYYNLYIKEKS